MTNKMECTIPKEKIWDTDYLKFILQATASSACFGTVWQYQPTSQRGYYDNRANLNAMIIAPFGTGKSSQILKINGAKIVRGNDFTFPGLIGTISKNGELVLGACYRAGGKLLMLDETQSIPLNVKNAMNSLFEGDHNYVRNLGYNIIKRVTKGTQKSGARIVADSNELNVYSKFSCIASSMYVELNHPVKVAWYSRFIPIRFKIDLNYIWKLTAGEIVYDIDAYYYKQVQDFKFNEFPDFHKYYREKIENSPWKTMLESRPNDMGYLPRNMQDIIRLGCFIALSKGRNEVLFEDTKYVIDHFLYQILYNIYMGPLGTTESYILNNIEKTQEKIAEELGVDQSTISKGIMRLKRLHLISGVIEDTPENKAIAVKEEKEWDRIFVPTEFT
jgi:hypothetical protein